jgi:pyruvate kinase
MNYEIIATLGPASESPQMWRAMVSAGATSFRLNTSHLTLAQLAGWLERLQRFAGDMPLVLDLQGSKWRLGTLSAETLVVDQRLELVLGQTAVRPGALPVPHPDFFAAAPLSDGEIMLNDARVRLRIERIDGDVLAARVIQGGPVSAYKGITFRACDFRNEALSAKDAAIYEQTRALPNLRYAISYIKDGQEMAHYRRMFGPGSGLIAKLERGPAMQAAVDIAQSADEVWVCRGDLGAELGLAAMAAAVHSLTAQVRSLAVPAIMAGQVLEHMTESATPTRSEVCYLYDTLQHGYRGFVLSDETAVGRDPLACCQAAALWR